MKYLFFDENAVQIIISRNNFQSTEYAEGKLLVQFLKGEKDSQLFEDIYIYVQDDGVIFQELEIVEAIKLKFFAWI